MYDQIIKRFKDVYFSIKNNGFNQHFKLNGYIRVIEFNIEKKDNFYLIRDGFHRCSVLSALNYEYAGACYEYDFHKTSLLRTYAKKILKKQNQQPYVAPIIKLSDVKNWPHVKKGNITVDEASVYFNKFINLSITK